MKAKSGLSLAKDDINNKIMSSKGPFDSGLPRWRNRAGSSLAQGDIKVKNEIYTTVILIPAPFAVQSKSCHKGL
jgi:hypothetical protein